MLPHKKTFKLQNSLPPTNVTTLLRTEIKKKTT